MRNWFTIPLVLIVLGVAGYFLYQNDAVRTLVTNVMPQSQDQTANQPKDTVIMRGFAFSPKTITIRAGDSVTWTNQDSAPHNIVADDGTWKTDTIAKDGSQSVPFPNPGTYSYHCSIHPSMTGTVIVNR